jgi:hypothetical protein
MQFFISFVLLFRAVPRRKNFVRAGGFMGFILRPHVVDNRKYFTSTHFHSRSLPHTLTRIQTTLLSSR